jgi:hypothetical protein
MNERPTITTQRVYGRMPDIYIYAIDGVVSTGPEGVGYFRTREQASAAARRAVERAKETNR